MASETSDICGVILAGGEGRRLAGRDKGLLTLDGCPFVESIRNQLSSQVSEVLISANRNIHKYRQFGTVIEDDIKGFHGPLAGMLAAMHYTNKPWIVTVPCDSPTLPSNLVDRLYRATQEHNTSISVAYDGTRLQPVYALINCLLSGSLYEYLMSGQQTVADWYQQHDFAKADFTDVKQQFRNINTPEDQEEFGAQ